MKLQYLATLSPLIPYVLCFRHFPDYRSLAGLSREEIRAVVRTFDSTPGAQPLPPRINDTSAKLVNDATHPHQPDRPGDIRGPCPGLNTLASHGYINRNGVATPAEIITSVQEGFNMGWFLASFLTYAVRGVSHHLFSLLNHGLGMNRQAFIVDGNHLTNLMSIGVNTTADDELTPGPNIHGNFEAVIGLFTIGDASTTREDYYFGNNYSFNETFLHIPPIKSAALDKALRINDSIARDPTLSFDTPRYLTAYAETTFPLAFFVNNQTANSTLNLTLHDARSFFELHKYPEGFYRRHGTYDFPQVTTSVDRVSSLVRILPGRNEGVRNYVVNPENPGSLCYAYQRQVNSTAQLYPNPTPELEAAIKANLVTFYQTLGNPKCEQLFPFGK